MDGRGSELWCWFVGLFACLRVSRRAEELLLTRLRPWLLRGLGHILCDHSWRA